MPGQSAPWGNRLFRPVGRFPFGAPHPPADAGYLKRYTGSGSIPAAAPGCCPSRRRSQSRAHRRGQKQTQQCWSYHSRLRRKGTHCCCAPPHSVAFALLLLQSVFGHPCFVSSGAVFVGRRLISMSLLCSLYHFSPPATTANLATVPPDSNAAPPCTNTPFPEPPRFVTTQKLICTHSPRGRLPVDPSAALPPQL